jgi:hypothetical protein
MLNAQDAQHAFIEQIKRDRGGNIAVLEQIRAGMLPAWFRADAMRRLADCDAILAQYS